MSWQLLWLLYPAIGVYFGRAFASFMAKEGGITKDPSGTDVFFIGFFFVMGTLLWPLGGIGVLFLLLGRGVKRWVLQ